MTPDERMERIWRVVAAVPPGRVVSYGEVARRAGLGRAARFVGRALRAAPGELDLPWHRVLRADGHIAFPAGSEAHREQARRLRAEGVTLRAGRVERHAWHEREELDRLIWGEGD